MPIVLFSLLLLPVFVALRWPFFRLPLHMDTGYYVSNNTICSGRIDFSKGWNATYAGCSKVLPEFFYSAIYLLHGGANQYKFFCRFYYSLYAFAAGPIVGYSCYLLSEGSLLAFWMGVLTYWLASSEARYGVYFESGEQFEAPVQIAGFLMILYGFQAAVPWLISLGIGLWALESYFIKLASMTATLVLAAGTGYLLPATIPFTLLALGTATGAYLWWIAYNGQSLGKILGPLIGHEVHFGLAWSVRVHLYRFIRKVGFLLFILLSHPIIPGVAVLGLYYGWDRAGLVLLYLAAVFVCYILQAAQVWYYTIPFIPVISVLAGTGAATVFPKGIGGPIAVISLLVLWLMTHLRWSWGTTLEELNRWTWTPHPCMPERNFALDGAAETIRAIVAGKSMLVYGHYTQAYTLVGASYPIRFIAPNDWLNVMAPDWQKELLQAIADLPPSYILDTDGKFTPTHIQERVGLRYELVQDFPGEFRLFKHVNGSPSQAMAISRPEALVTHRGGRGAGAGLGRGSEEK